MGRMAFTTAVAKYRWWIATAWFLLAGSLWVFAPKNDPGRNEVESFLPSDAPARVAAARLAKYFPRQYGLSQAVVFFERPEGPLTLDDQTYINGTALRFLQPLEDDLSARDLLSLRVLTPGMIDAAFAAARTADVISGLRSSLRDTLRGNPPLLPTTREAPPPNPLLTPVGPNGQGALVRVNLPSDFITYRAAQMVRHIRRILAHSPPPAGLRVSVTGSAGYGHDYSRFVQDSHDHTILTTLLAVVLILLLVYRAPAAALVPLVSISLAAGVVIRGIDLAQNAGLAIGVAERIFAFVLLYGAGIDYSLLYLSRYREFLSAGTSAARATAQALRATLPAISASAATDAAGIFLLIFCRFVIFRTTGPVVAVALLVSLLAAITLVPALACLCGRWLYWPRREIPGESAEPSSATARSLWPLLARFVTRRPGAVLAVGLLLLLVPSVRATRIHWVYDALAGIRAAWNDALERPTAPGEGIGNAAAGVEAAVRHMPIGEIAPVTLLIEGTGAMPLRRWEDLSRTLTSALESLPGVRNVRSLTQPLGAGYAPPPGGKTELMVRLFGQSEYLGDQGRAMRLDAVLDCHTMSDAAMTLTDTIRRTARDVLDRSGFSDAQLHLGGATTQMNEIRNITQRDFRLVAVLVLAVIFVIVLALLRDWRLTGFMVGAIGLSYLATLGLCAWAFQAWFGEGGMDWKVQIFLFVVMAAVGVDYNIFLADRLRQESRHHPPREAIRRALIATGPVISSCGVIMAASLGSLMVGHVELLWQLGFSMALGMLMDTFVIRPLLLPAFAALLRRDAPGAP